MAGGSDMMDKEDKKELMFLYGFGLCVVVCMVGLVWATSVFIGL